MPLYNSPTWKKLANRYVRDAKFGRPASEKRIAAVEQSLGVCLPDALREFLLEANGMRADHGADLIWSVADIERFNQEFRTSASFRPLYMPFDHLLFFGQDGGGDQFAYAIHGDGQIHNEDIFLWEHESDARSWFAGRLEQFLEKRLKKKTDR